MATESIGGTDLRLVVNRLTVCYDDLGSGTTPIIFVHGFPFNKSTWQPQLEYFKKSHRVIAYDIRGYGNSTDNTDIKSVSLFATDLIHLMDALRIQQAVLCGLSMGGYILLNAESRYPERFKALVLCDTQCIPDSPEAKVKRHETIAEITDNGPKGFTDKFIQNVFCPATLKTKTELVERTRKTMLATSLNTLTCGLKALENRWDMCKSLNEIVIPALVLCGREDKVTPLEESEFLHHHMAHSQLHIIDHAGHLSNLEQPDEFNAHLEKFITGLGI